MKHHEASFTKHHEAPRSITKHHNPNPNLTLTQPLTIFDIFRNPHQSKLRCLVRLFDSILTASMADKMVVRILGAK
jgi:hypothetical protein